MRTLMWVAYFLANMVIITGLALGIYFTAAAGNFAFSILFGIALIAATMSLLT